MALTWTQISALAVSALAEAGELAPTLKTNSPQTDATNALNAAAVVASTVLTDPTEQSDAAAAFGAAQALINLFFRFKS